MLVEPRTWQTRRNHPDPMRLVEADLEVDGRLETMKFLTNNLERAASRVAELYRCRWQIEVFFKQLKQTVQLADFLGHSANAMIPLGRPAHLPLALPRFRLSDAC